jgi:hypothetical protein
MLSRRGSCFAENVVAQRMLSHRGCCRAKKFVAHRMLSRSGFSRPVGCRAWDVIVQWIFLRTGYRSHCANYWFSGQLQDQFMTNWRGILKIPESVLLRTNQIIKNSLRFVKCVMVWYIRRNL